MKASELSNMVSIEREYAYGKTSSAMSRSRFLEQADSGFAMYGSHFNLDSIAFKESDYIPRKQMNAIALTWLQGDGENSANILHGSVTEMSLHEDVLHISTLVSPEDVIYNNRLPHPQFKDDNRHFHVFNDPIDSKNVLPTASTTIIHTFEIKLYFPFLLSLVIGSAVTEAATISTAAAGAALGADALAATVGSGIYIGTADGG